MGLLFTMYATCITSQKLRILSHTVFRMILIINSDYFLGKLYKWLVFVMEMQYVCCEV